MVMQIKVEGLEQVRRKMAALPKKFALAGAKRGLRKGANVIRDAARRNAKRLDDPKSAEDIAKNITTQGGSAKRNRSEGGVVMRVGVMGGARSKRSGVDYTGKAAPGGDTWYWRLLEFGTSKMAAQPFMRPALSENVESAISASVTALNTELDKEVAKL